MRSYEAIDFKCWISENHYRSVWQCFVTFPSVYSNRAEILKVLFQNGLKTYYLKFFMFENCTKDI